MGAVDGREVDMPTGAPACSGKARAAQTAHVCAPTAPGACWSRSGNEAVPVFQMQVLLDWEAEAGQRSRLLRFMTIFPR